MQVLAAFHWDCGRQGEVEGLFVCDEKDLTQNYGKAVYFGEILGKHSEIEGTLDEGDIEIKTRDQDFIQKLTAILGGGTISGYNPLEYLSENRE